MRLLSQLFVSFVLVAAMVWAGFAFLAPVASVSCESTGIPDKYVCEGTVTGAAHPLRKCEWKKNSNAWYNDDLTEYFYCYPGDVIYFRIQDYNWAWSNTASTPCPFEP